MRSLKSRIIGVIMFVFLFGLIAIVPQIYAEEAPTTTETVTELTCEELVDKYGLYIEATGNPDEFRLIKDPKIKCEGEYHSTAAFNVVSVNGTRITGVTINKSNKTYVFKAGYLGPIEENKYYVSVIVENADNIDEKIEVRFIEEREAAGTGTVGKSNSNYNDYTILNYT